jgi:hypothetical protein
VNLVIVHDGDADEIPQIMHQNRYNYVLCDREHKFQDKIVFDTYARDAIRTSIFKWFSHVTNTKIFGFFIVSDGRSTIRSSLNRRFRFDDSQDRMNSIDRLVTKLRTEKFIVSNNSAYEKFFFILGGKSLITEDFDNFDTKDENLSVRKLKNEFVKKYENRKVNRVLVNQFIQGIAK